MFSNVTFLGYDRTRHLPKYANVRGINGDFKGDAPGSDKRYSFLLKSEGQSDEVHICEAAIDVLSYATLLKMQGKNYQDFPDFQKVAMLLQQLSWSHFVELLPIQDSSKREFYVIMCANEGWNVKTLREKNLCYLKGLPFQKDQRKQ